MKIVKMGSLPKEAATSALFTGDVTRQTVFAPGDSSNFNFGIVSFSAGSRNKFHKHSGDQILIVTEGTGRAQTEGSPVQTLNKGDVVWFGPGEKHWHGAAPDSA